MTAASWTPTRCLVPFQLDGTITHRLIASNRAVPTSRRHSAKIVGTALAWLCTLTYIACSDPPDDSTVLAPSFHRDGAARGTVVVDPAGRHDATTIQAGIALAPAGGRVRVMPGTYPEALVINKGLTLEGIGGEGHDGADDDHEPSAGDRSGAVIVAPPGTPTIAVQVATPDPVTIRSLTVHFGGFNGIRGDGLVNLTVERATVIAVNPPFGTIQLVSVLKNVASAGRARLVVQESFLDGGMPFANSPPPSNGSVGIRVNGDVDALFDGNIIRRMSTCISVQSRDDLGGDMHADITGNDLDECYPMSRVGVIIVGTAAGNAPSATRPVTATGVVNIVGNAIRNSFASCLPGTAISYTLFAGRIEHNRIVGVVQPCALPSARGAPGAIFVGDARDFYPAAAPVVRFNDIVGNAQAGVRVNRHQTTPLDLRCNYWGSASGPSGAGLTGTGDAIVVEAGAATPVFAPWATGPVARHRRDADHEDADDDDGHAGGRCRLEFSLWSEPVNLGPVINSSAVDFHPAISKNGLSLYFSSARAGGVGGNDNYFSQRDCVDCAWKTPVNLAVLNSTGSDIAPTLSRNERLLFFSSDRAHAGNTDIYVSRRADPKDDLGWEAPTLLGADVNTAAQENIGDYLRGNIYFNRNVTATGVPGPNGVIYYAPVTGDGATRGPAVLIAELTDYTATNASPTLRCDGREIFFVSNRAGSFAGGGGIGTGNVTGNDIWTSTRRSVHDAWSTPVNVGPPVSTNASEATPGLSPDGTTLYFDSDRPGGSGGRDIWMSTRTRLHHGDDGDNDNACRGDDDRGER